MSAMEKRILLEKNNRCICCGEFIPEGKQVCPKCAEPNTESETKHFKIRKDKHDGRIH